MAYIRLVAYKKKIKRYFDKQVHLRDFHGGDLILKKTNNPRKEVSKGKMNGNWEGSYRVIKSLQNGAYF